MLTRAMTIHPYCTDWLLLEWPDDWACRVLARGDRVARKGMILLLKISPNSTFACDWKARPQYTHIPARTHVAATMGTVVMWPNCRKRYTNISSHWYISLYTSLSSVIRQPFASIALINFNYKLVFTNRKVVS